MSSPPKLLQSPAGRALTLALAALFVLGLVDLLARLAVGGEQRYYHTRLLETLPPAQAAQLENYMNALLPGFEEAWHLPAHRVLDTENFVLDEKLVYRLKPGLDMQAINFTLPKEEREQKRWHYNANAEGWRGPLLHEKPPGVKRIVVLGDSTSYGWGLSEEESWPYLLQQYLGEGWEVFNRAVPGYTTYQGEILAQSELEELQPDYVTISFGANDSMPYPMREEEIALSVGSRLGSARSFFDRFAITRLLAMWLAPRGELTQRVPPAEYSSRLRKIIEAADAVGAASILLGLCDTAEPYTRQLGALGQLRGDPVFDMHSDSETGLYREWPVYDSCPFAKPEELGIRPAEGKPDIPGYPARFFADRCHPNELGARLNAYQLACYIWKKEHPMPAPTFSLEHTHRRPDERSGGKPPALIALHGIGSNDKDLIALQPYLDPRLFVIAARAPHEYGFPGGYSWFDLGIDPRTGSVNVDLKQVEESRDLIIEFIDEVVAAYGLDSGRVYLMGFSQGTMMSYAVLAKAPGKIAGIIAMSGRFVPQMFEGLDTATLKDFPILVTHGTLDDVLPIANGRASKEALEKLPVALTYKEYPMAHEVSQAYIGDVAAWIKERLGE